MNKRTIILNSQFDRKVSTTRAQIADEKESFAATIPVGRRSPAARRIIKRAVDRWCDEYRQLIADIDAEIIALCADDTENGTTTNT